jgi:hypothetical protein
MKGRGPMIKGVNEENDGKKPRIACNATWSHSLRSPDASANRTLILETVAKDVVELSFYDSAEHPSNSNGQSMQIMGVS